MLWAIYDRASDLWELMGEHSQPDVISLIELIVEPPRTRVMRLTGIMASHYSNRSQGIEKIDGWSDALSDQFSVLLWIVAWDFPRIGI
jgi:hypothetical protein